MEEKFFMKKMFNIISKNQKGGVTVGEMNSTPQPQKNEFWHNPIIIYLVFPIIVGIVIYFVTNSSMTDNVFNVTSNNQQGEMTVGQLNMDTPARHLEGEYKTELGNILPSDKEKGIIISHVNDSEAKQFAYEVKNYLDQNGYRVVDIRAILQGDPFNGWGVGPEENGNFKLLIGSNLY